MYYCRLTALIDTMHNALVEKIVDRMHDISSQLAVFISNCDKNALISEYCSNRAIIKANFIKIPIYMEWNNIETYISSYLFEDNEAKRVFMTVDINSFSKKRTF